MIGYVFLLLLALGCACVSGISVTFGILTGSKTAKAAAFGVAATMALNTLITAIGAAAAYLRS